MKKKITALVFLSALLLLLFSSCNVYVNGRLYADAEKYTAGEATLDTTVENWDIEWACGEITVEYHEEDTILLREVCEEELTDEYKLHWYLDGTTLHVHFMQSGITAKKTLHGSLKKELIITIPEAYRAKDITCSLASADMETRAIHADTYTVSTASGDVTLNADTVKSATVFSASGTVCFVADTVKDLAISTASGTVNAVVFDSAETVSVSTASGEINVDLKAAKQVDIETSSGKINGAVDGIDILRCNSSSGDVTVTLFDVAQTEIDTSSADVTLSLPQEAGFTMQYTTSSGKMKSDFAMKQNDEVYTVGDGTNRIQIQTSSGRLTLYELKE